MYEKYLEQLEEAGKIRNLKEMCIRDRLSFYRFHMHKKL